MLVEKIVVKKYVGIKYKNNTNSIKYFRKEILKES
jgi:hypothetical protein